MVEDIQFNKQQSDSKARLIILNLYHVVSSDHVGSIISCITSLLLCFF